MSGDYRLLAMRLRASGLRAEKENVGALNAVHEVHISFLVCLYTEPVGD